MIRPTRSLLLLALAGFLAAAEPAPALVISFSGGTVELERYPTARVLEETVDGITFRPDGASKEPKTIPRGNYKVEYAEPGEIAVFRGAKAAEEERKYDDALVQYQEVQKVDRFRWVSERAVLGEARCLLVRKRPDPDRAIATLDRFTERYPKSILLPQAQDLRARALLAKGQTDQALATFAALADQAKVYGRDALLLGGRGQAQIYVARKDHGKAAEILGRLLKLIDPEQDPAAWAPLALDQARSLDAAGRAAKDEARIAQARDLWTRISVARVTPGQQAEAHGELAATLQEGAKDTKTLLAAFDQAAIAIVTAPESPAATQARGMIRQIFDRLDRAADLTAADKAEHRAALANL